MSPPVLLWQAQCFFRKNHFFLLWIRQDSKGFRKRLRVLEKVSGKQNSRDQLVHKAVPKVLISMTDICLK